MENLKIPWNEQKLAKHGYFEKQSVSGYFVSSHQISGWYLESLKRCPLDLVKKAYHGKFKSSMEHTKIVRA